MASGAMAGMQLGRRDELEAVLERVTQHCVAECGGSFLSGLVRARLFASTIGSFGHESLTPAPGPADEGALDKLLRSTAHRIVRQQSSLDAKWYEQTKAALAGTLSLAADEEGQLAAEAALSETFVVVALAACVFTFYVALEGPTAATARCKEQMTRKQAKDPLVSAEHWNRLRRLSPNALTRPGTPLLKPFGAGDNAAKGGNRMHALQAGVKGDLLPSSVQAFLEFAASMPGGPKGLPMRSCTLAPGDMEAYLQTMSKLYLPIAKFLSFSKLPGRELSRAEMECVADGTAGTVACSF
eukprot:TRINITY_DN14384_c1_g1_i1.p1 TRINITY_DN14384_c1_g1~~TRINITY_DN14384_c1_g1_i1.p1  ORF type:complete len:312 (+),score=44.36 TRINITY_DN14384_c1_g1_i1:45-938(+)